MPFVLEFDGYDDRERDEKDGRAATRALGELSPKTR